MAIKPIVLYDNVLAVEYGRIYWNSQSAAFYSDADCQNQITRVGIPRREQYKFANYTSGTGSTSTERISAAGVIDMTWNPGASTTELKIYAQWSKLSMVFTITNASTTLPPQWTIPVSAVYRSTTTGTQAYRDDQLTDGPITKIAMPVAEEYACSGIGFNSSTNYIDANGNILAALKNYATPTSLTAALHPYGLRCYYLALYANEGHGGEPANVYYNRVRDVWCRDKTLTQDFDRVKWPTRPGYYCDGYNTKADNTGTKVVSRAGYLMDAAKVTENTSAYAIWKPAIVITLDRQGGTGASKIYFGLYMGEGQFYADANLEQQTTKITPPTKTNHRFLGYFYNGEKVIDEAGNILATTASANLTVTAQWERVSYTVNISLNGGTGPAAIYADVAKTGYFATDQCDGQPLASVSISKAGSKFDGVYSIDGDKIVEDDGTFTAYAQTFLAALSEDATLTAYFRTVATITLDAQGGTAPAPVLYFDADADLFYDAPQMTTPVTTIGRPRKECNGFVGYSTEDGAQVVDAAGNISATWKPTEDATIAATWERISWKLAINPDGGSGGSTAVYRNGGATWYADDQCTTPTTKIVPPTRHGYTFAGAYANGDTKTTVVRADGTITASPSLQSDNLTGTALWTANTYTLTFDYNGGTGTTQHKTVTFGQPIGELPTATRNRAVFTGWRIDGESVEATTAYNVPGDGRAVAAWSLQFGNVTDYFGLASSSLIPIASDSGDNKKRICVAHIGKYETNVDAVSGTWRNPTVTYVVARNMTLALTLGRAYKGSGSVTGYMIVAARIATGVGQFPTVTIQAVANEGADAINKFNVSVPIVARSKAQNLLGAVSGGGHLNGCALTATCEPVVVEENMMPCASDVVNGRYEVEATTIATNRESAPGASGGFTSIGEPKEETDATYTTYKLNAQREIR